MTASSFLYLLGTVPVFASRAFVPALVTSLLARFGEKIPLVRGTDVVAGLQHVPPWFTSNTTIAILSVLAAAEMFASRSAEVRAVLAELDHWLKSAVAFLVSMALLDKESVRILKTMDQSVFSLHGFVSLAIASSVWVVSGWRRDIVHHLADVDEDDDLGVQSLFRWSETAWTFVALFFLVFLPILALIVSALVSLTLWWMRRRAERKEEERRVPCPACGVRIHASAPRCSACRNELPSPRKIGVFGQPLDEPAPEPREHRFQLVARKRCPSCAARLRERTLRQSCKECAGVTFEDERAVLDYLDRLGERLPRTIGITFALGFIPVLGLIPGVVYYRLALISGMRGYLPLFKGCTTRWLARLVNYGLVAFQVVPIFGAIVLPLMCWSNYALYRRALAAKARELASPAAPG